MTRSEIEKLANEILNKYVSRGGAHKQFNKICESENIKYREIKSNPYKFAGVFTKATKNEQKYIIINSNIDNVGRKNFTIAHELGHYFLNHQLKSSMYIDTAINEECSNKDTIEYEADYFATCLLMPEEKVTRAVTSMLYRLNKGSCTTPFCITKSNYKIWATICKYLIERYGVSETALRYRLKTLNLINITMH